MSRVDGPGVAAAKDITRSECEPAAMTMSLKVLAAALATAAIIVAPASALTAAHGSDLRPWTTTHQSRP